MAVLGLKLGSRFCSTQLHKSWLEAIFMEVHEESAIFIYVKIPYCNTMLCWKEKGIFIINPL